MDPETKNRIGSIFSVLMRKKNTEPTVEPILEIKEEQKKDNVECSMISHIDELIKVTDFMDLGVSEKREKQEQTIILENTEILRYLIQDYKSDEPKLEPKLETNIHPPQVKPQEAKLTLSLRGKSSLPISYSFYKCNMLMEYSTGPTYNFDNDLVINPGRYEISSKYIGDNVDVKMSFSDYSMADTGKFYRTENLTDFTIVEVVRKTKISFFAYPHIMGNAYDIKMIEININLINQ